MSSRFKITIVSDSMSWLNQYIPTLIKHLEQQNHQIEWFHDITQVSNGDFVFYLSCGQIIPSNILEKNKHNLVVHESDLPNGKGWSPLTWQILEGKHEIPISLFEAEETIDSGAIYLRDTLKFQGTELIDELRQSQAIMTIKLCYKFVQEYPNILQTAKEQKGKSTYYRKRQPEDSRLDPAKTIQEQFNLLRVVDNKRYPAFFELNGEKYILQIYKDNHEK